MILLVGGVDDEPIEAVRAELARRGSDVLHVSDRTGVEIRHISSGTAPRFLIITSAGSVDSRTISAAYLRPWADAETDEAWGPAMAAVTSWADRTDAFVVNRPADSESNLSKPYQTTLLNRCGFETPPTIVTTSSDDAVAFARHHGRVVYKSISNRRSKVATITADELTTRLASRPPMSFPTQFQRYIPGIEFRVHVLGSRLWACRIESDAADYRYAADQGRDLHMAHADLPDRVAQLCLSATRRLGLAFSGIDLRCDPDGRWFALEANTSPGYTFFERLAGLDITNALADALATPRRLRR
jgi:glutathione synthase/RimK-type ligase-like ATP-grasp enzyme